MSSTGARPAFPVRLNLEQIRPRAPAEKIHHGLKQPFHPGNPKGLGLDCAVRARMVRRLAEQGVGDARLLLAMQAVQRHQFVDRALASLAYDDTSLPIGFGQTISKPSVVARMLELLQHGLADAGGRLGRVLEVGTGCGYQAAVLSHLATEVYSIERLRGLRLPNVHLLFGDGMQGFAKGAPYAGIVVAAVGRAIPAAWTEQLALGGRLVAPLEDASGAQALVVIDRTAQGIRQTLLEPVHFVPLKSGVG